MESIWIEDSNQGMRATLGLFDLEKLTVGLRPLRSKRSSPLNEQCGKFCYSCEVCRTRANYFSTL